LWYNYINKGKYFLWNKVKEDKLMSKDDKEKDKDLAKVGSTTIGAVDEKPMGFEDEEPGDMIIPRIKVIQTLSPERKDGSANEGAIINSLTKDVLNGKIFVPVFKFNNNIDWKDRSEGGGINCIAREGKIGEDSTGKQLLCASCRRCEFDNSKQGKEAIPKCTKYINFFGFIAGERVPIILSFAKTNYAEGKRLYSLAKVTMQNMFNYGYILHEKLKAKGGNEWYIIETAPAGPTSEDDRAFAVAVFKTYREDMSFKYDMEDAKTDDIAGGPAPDLDKVEI
jgi:hypothetical protein